MTEDELKPNDQKILTYLLNRLVKRIYLLRVSLYGDTEKYFPDGVLVSKEKLEADQNEFEATYNLSSSDYRLMVDCCEIESHINHILNELTSMKTYKSLKEIIMELENEKAAFKKHKEMVEAKRRQIDQVKETLTVLEEQTQVDAQHLDTLKYEATGEKTESFDQTDLLKKLMDHKVKSRKEYYKHKEIELQESIEWFERETRTQEHVDAQTISFWLLRYDDYSEKLDKMLKEMFDNWAAKQRELDILRKYRKLNLEKIQKLEKLILEREKYIEKDRVKKEKEQQEREQERRKEISATIIQAYWRGTMVRKHLGPYKLKKSKKGKKGKGKKKKK